jgi:O-antigen/teichoic acid export membrane protein
MAGFGPPGLAKVFFSLFFFLTFILIKEYFRKIYFAHFRPELALLLDITIGIIQIAFLLFIAFFFYLTAPKIFIVIGFVSGIICSIWYVYNKNNFLFSLNDIKNDFFKNYVSGKWIFFSSIVWLLSTEIYPWLISIFHGLSEAAVFGVCMRTIALSRPLIFGMNNIIEPLLSHSYSDGGLKGLKKSAFKNFKFIFIVFFPIVILVSLFGNKLIIFLFGYKYAGYNFIIAILALNSLITALVFPFSRSLFVMERANIDFMINILSSVFTLTCGLILVNRLGLLGAAMALVASNFIGLSVKFFAFNLIIKKCSNNV